MENIALSISVAAKLSPEIRLAQAISEFYASLGDDRNRQARFKNLQTRRSPDSVQIIKLTEEINRDGARQHRPWRPYATRLVMVLERIQQFAGVGDVLIGGTQNMLASGVWATVRTALEVSQHVNTCQIYTH